VIRVALALALAALLAEGGLCADAASVEIRDSELVVSTGGRVLPRSELIGAVLGLAREDGGTVNVRIDRIVTDPGRDEGDVVLYDLSVAGGEGAPVCPAEADGNPQAMLQPGPGGTITIFCTAGAKGKCIRWGYRPWAERDGVSLEPYWRACVRMVRADYCGDDSPTTLDGMLISIYDTLGIQQRDEALDFTFEAAWDAQGALCAAHPRVPQNITLEALATACPRLAGRLGSACTEVAARHFGTPLLYNASRGDGVPERAR
jgi:hypothetical protein